MDILSLWELFIALLSFGGGIVFGAFLAFHMNLAMANAVASFFIIISLCLALWIYVKLREEEKKETYGIRG
jgi:hypothetical protein